jgi:hypothetical protein
LGYTESVQSTRLRLIEVAMRLTVALLGLAMSAPAAHALSPFDEAARRLDGVWRGDGYALKVDARRAQANIDPEKPFQWQRFEVKEVGDGEIVFSVGAEIFEAKLAGDELELTSTAFRGERLLERQATPGPGEPADLGLRGATAD